MHDGAKIITGLGAFVAAALIPFWANLGARPTLPRLTLGTKATRCVAPKEQILASHMEILNRWRSEVVRTGRRTALDAFGQPVTMSLTGTCLSCHANKAEFCDRCHASMAVTPYCWECHLEPKGRAS
jgi:[DsrC]-trisulfide reductase subunit J